MSKEAPHGAVVDESLNQLQIIRFGVFSSFIERFDASEGRSSETVGFRMLQKVYRKHSESVGIKRMAPHGAVVDESLNKLQIIRFEVFPSFIERFEASEGRSRETTGFKMLQKVHRKPSEFIDVKRMAPHGAGLHRAFQDWISTVINA